MVVAVKPVKHRNSTIQRIARILSMLVEVRAEAPRLQPVMVGAERLLRAIKDRVAMAVLTVVPQQVVELAAILVTAVMVIIIIQIKQVKAAVAQAVMAAVRVEAAAESVFFK